MIQSYVENDINIRLERIGAALASNGYDAILITSNANLYYTAGRVFSG